jgi:hypothetical protein
MGFGRMDKKKKYADNLMFPVLPKIVYAKVVLKNELTYSKKNSGHWA